MIDGAESRTWRGWILVDRPVGTNTVSVVACVSRASSEHGPAAEQIQPIRRQHRVAQDGGAISRAETRDAAIASCRDAEA
jgi:hypothetical protein